MRVFIFITGIIFSEFAETEYSYVQQLDSHFHYLKKSKIAYENNVTLDYSRPGKQTDNPFIESFNGSFLDECLIVYWFMSLKDAKGKIETWRYDYNQFRPRNALNNMTPIEYIKSSPISTNNSV